MRARSFARWALAGALALVTVACSDDTGVGDGDAGPPDSGTGGMMDGSTPPDGTVAMRCGNGMLEGSEECDDGNRTANDGCASDCTLECGDGTVTGAELCDTAIAAGDPGACPADCDDGDACTTDSLTGADCSAECVHGDITVPTDGDGCCPPGADSSTDADCGVVCGNGVLEVGETCDTAIAAGDPGACPTDCDDGIACTADALTGAECTAACENVEITAPMSGDGCCPMGATIGTDSDCTATCGDGVVTSPETCDTAITTGTGRCPTMASCNDGMACTADSLIGGGTCMAACRNTPITTPMAGDGCCPPGATIGSDSDCPARCGDGVVTPPETCDDGNTTSGDGCSATCRTEVTATAFRVSSLALRDPHAFTRIAMVLCVDITSNLNTALSNAITMDGDGDGALDLSLVQVFRPLDQRSGITTPSDLTFPDCTAPMSSTMCTLPAGATRTAANATNQASGTCLGIIPMTTTTAFTPAPTTPSGPCYVSTVGDLTISLSGIPITLRQTSVGATYSGAPATQLVNGLIRGFLTEADANATTIPASVMTVGGMRLSSVLPGGMGCCRASTTAGREMDTLPDGTRGWWFYLNFTAQRVPYTEM